MSKQLRIIVLSDIHYAGLAEQARGITESRVQQAALTRWAAKAFRHYIWRRDPLAHNQGVDRFLAACGAPDWVIANGDYSCDTAFIGISDEAACQSTRECLGRLRSAFGERLRVVYGDHELGKMSLFGGQGGMRLASWRRATEELRLPPFWQLALGRYRIMGVVSSLLALPVYEPETLAVELPEWQRLRAHHIAEIGAAFASLGKHERVLLFCHDPTALPFLWGEAAVRSRLELIAQTFIGHLHSDLFLWNSRLLAGIPSISFLGNSIRRMSAALREARHWRGFKVRLCPALTGIELFKSGGFYEIQLPLSDDAAAPAYVWHPLRQGPSS